jgi:hypothetical protein
MSLDQVNRIFLTFKSSKYLMIFDLNRTNSDTLIPEILNVH